MHPATPAALLALSLLVSSPAVAHSGSKLDCEAVPRHVELGPEVATPALTLCLAPGEELTLIFDALLCKEPFHSPDRERFQDMAPGRQRLHLTAPKDLRPGEELSVTVCFAGGKAPVEATFVMVGDLVHSTRWVEVFRKERPVPDILQELRETQNEVLQLRAEIERLRAERSSPSGLTGLRLAGLVNAEKGVAVRKLTDAVTPDKRNALKLERMTSYRAVDRLMLEVCLLNLGSQPWMPGRLVLRDERSKVLNPLSVWGKGPVEPGVEEGCLYLEAPATEAQARQRYWLALEDEAGERAVFFSDITFP